MSFLLFKHKYNLLIVYFFVYHVILFLERSKPIIMTDKKHNNSFDNMNSVWSENDLKELFNFLVDFDKIKFLPIDFSSLEPPTFDDLEDVNISDLIKELKKR